MLWVVRECLSGEVLLARSPLSSTATELAPLLAEVPSSAGEGPGEAAGECEGPRLLHEGGAQVVDALEAPKGGGFEPGVQEHRGEACPKHGGRHGAAEGGPVELIPHEGGGREDKPAEEEDREAVPDQV